MILERGQWFIAFLNANKKSDEFPGGLACAAMPSFCTELKRIPFGGLSDEISVRFLPDNDQYSLRTVSALEHESEGFPNI